jgi:hypothetical protein
MARKANYQFERLERDRAKAAKAAEKAATKRREADEAQAVSDNAASPKAED